MLAPSCSFGRAVHAPKGRNELSSPTHSQGSLWKLGWKQPGHTAELRGQCLRERNIDQPILGSGGFPSLSRDTAENPAQPNRSFSLGSKENLEQAVTLKQPTVRPAVLSLVAQGISPSKADAVVVAAELPTLHLKIPSHTSVWPNPFHLLPSTETQPWLNSIDN